MMLFQGDQILLNRVIKPLRRRLLTQLQALVLANKPSNWFTIFLCAFVLLQNYELCCAHDVRFSALQNLKVCADTIFHQFAIRDANLSYHIRPGGQIRL